MALNVTSTSSTALAVSLRKAKLQLKVSTGSTAENGEIKDKVRSATQWCERHIGGHRRLTPTTYRLTLGEFPCNSGAIVFPLPPLAPPVGTITYRDGSNVAQTLASTTYDTVAPDDQPGWIQPKQSESWPSTYWRPDAVQIAFTCGYGSTSTTALPPAAQEAILVMTESAYDPTRLPQEEAEEIAGSYLDSVEYGHYA
jgi:hypothetical protein